MNKILVTTDLSSNSKSGLMFAIQLALQNSYELTFFHSYYIMKPTTWSAKSFGEYEKREVAKIEAKFHKFVESVYKSMGIRSEVIHYAIKKAISPGKNIRSYAKENGYDFICISTRGAGKLKKVLGTNSSTLINTSLVPVIVVPSTYHSKKVDRILYASDLSNIDKELKKVVSFAKPLGAKIEIVHFNYPAETKITSSLLDKSINRHPEQKIKIHLENINLAKSLLQNIEEVVKNTKPSMMVMFTQQNRGFFQKIFFASNSAEYSFNSRVPLLVFTKT